MTSSNENILCVTGPLCGEFTGHHWIPRTKASDAELWCFVWSEPWINNREAGDLRRHSAHYDVTLMSYSSWQRIGTLLRVLLCIVVGRYWYILPIFQEIVQAIISWNSGLVPSGNKPLSQLVLLSSPEKYSKSSHGTTKNESSQWRHISEVASQTNHLQLSCLTACLSWHKRKHQAVHYWPL